MRGGNASGVEDSTEPFLTVESRNLAYNHPLPTPEDVIPVGRIPSQRPPWTHSQHTRQRRETGQSKGNEGEQGNQLGESINSVCQGRTCSHTNDNTSCTRGRHLFVDSGLNSLNRGPEGTEAVKFSVPEDQKGAKMSENHPFLVFIDVRPYSTNESTFLGGFILQRAAAGSQTNERVACGDAREKPRLRPSL